MKRLILITAAIAAVTAVGAANASAGEFGVRLEGTEGSNIHFTSPLLEPPLNMYGERLQVGSTPNPHLSNSVTLFEGTATDGQPAPITCAGPGFHLPPTYKPIYGPDFVFETDPAGCEIQYPLKTAVSVSMNSCHYEISDVQLEEGGAYHGAWSISCEKAGDKVELKTPAVGCTIKLPPQQLTELSEFAWNDFGLESTPYDERVTALLDAESVEYQVNFACKLAGMESRTDGEIREAFQFVGLSYP